MSLIVFTAVATGGEEAGDENDRTDAIITDAIGMLIAFVMLFLIISIPFIFHPALFFV
jgi:hypothetical protein